jgi:glycosyltransferase involved in cell wall biosynthesis
MDQAMTTASSIPAPLVSVLMSCYNASYWLEESIQSVLNQSYNKFEFIIVDDGSKDDTLAIIQRHAANDDRIVVISKANTGLADSLNVGITQARGEWIARQDADDISEPTRLERQVQFAIAHPRLVFIGTGLTEIDGSGRKLSVHRYPSGHSQLVSYLETAKKFPPHSSAFYRAGVVRSIGGYRPRIRRSQDTDLWLRLSEVGELASIEEPLVKIRRHADQISYGESGRRQQIDSRVAMTSYWLRKKGECDPVNAEQAAFNTFYAWLEKKIVDDGLFEFQDHRRHLKMALTNEETCVSKWLSFGITFVARPLLSFRLLRERLLGERTAAQLASKWIKAQE